jgi:putative transposase
MPRKVRQLCDGGIYHVFNRGNDRRQLFADPDDFKAFLSRVLDLKLELSVEVIHYCLMNNHFHFLLRVVNGQDLIKFMHRLQLGYVQYFKKKYSFVGHVFQERFRSPLINGESYYLQCGRYIERNPVKAGVVKLAWEYKWSSAGFYCLGESNLLITPNNYYHSLGFDDHARQEEYRKFLAVEEPYRQIVDEALLKLN